MLATVVSGQTRLADRGYGADCLRDPLAARDAVANIKPMSNRKRVPAFDRTFAASAAPWNGLQQDQTLSCACHPLRQDG